MVRLHPGPQIKDLLTVTLVRRFCLYGRLITPNGIDRYPSASMRSTRICEPLNVPPLGPILTLLLDQYLGAGHILRRVMQENLKKNRLMGMDAAWVEKWRT